MHTSSVFSGLGGVKVRLIECRTMNRLDNVIGFEIHHLLVGVEQHPAMRWCYRCDIRIDVKFYLTVLQIRNAIEVCGFKLVCE